MSQGGRTNRGWVWRPFFVQERKFWEGCNMKFSSLKKVLAIGLAAVVVVGALAGCGDNKAGAQKKFLNIGTGGTAGTYYPSAVPWLKS